nr:hypothetical protein [Propionibacterium sp.]
MTPAPTEPLAAARLRTNPAYEVVVADRLTGDEADLFRSLAGGGDLFGLLRPDRAGLSYKAVDAETALLLFTLATPGPLPSFARAKLGPDCDRVVADLVLSGVLEVEGEGGFRSGPDAEPALFARPATAGRGRTGQLSLAALRYGQRLGALEPSELASRLYAFNRAPLTPAWQRRLPGPDAVLDHLGLGPGGRLQPRLTAAWAAHGPDRGWLSWSSRAVRAAAEPGALTYKLYLSPTLEALPELVEAWVAASPRLRAFSFKLGLDAAGLLRPDKCVAYFATLDDLARAGDVLSAAMQGLPAQGVPFTAGITADGLLSWGVDPPRRGTGRSWRLWVAEHAARSLAAAAARPAAAGGTEPWLFALRRLQVAGVDTDTWQPTGAWRADVLEGE